MLVLRQPMSEPANRGASRSEGRHVVDLQRVRRQDEVSERMTESAPCQNVNHIEAGRVIGSEQEAGWGREPAHQAKHACQQVSRGCRPASRQLTTATALGLEM